MTVNSTLAHSAIKSLKHAQECMAAISTEQYIISAATLDTHIHILERMIVDEMAVTETSEEVVERGE